MKYSNVYQSYTLVYLSSTHMYTHNFIDEATLNEVFANAAIKYSYVYHSSTYKCIHQVLTCIKYHIPISD